MRTIFFVWCCLGFSISAAVFQYAVPISTPQGDRTVFLWLPPEVDGIRGVLMAGMTLMERECVNDPVIREACASEQLAIVFYRSGLSVLEPQIVLDALAQASGYRELAFVPMFFVGHSSGGPQAKARAIQHADRCFGLMQYRGGGPNGEARVPPGVPYLMMLGQFDEFSGMMRDEKGREAWERGRDELLTFRSQDPAHLGSLVVEPGAGHFAWSERNAEYFSRFIKKAAQARIPEGLSQTREPVICKTVDPTDGWLAPVASQAPSAFTGASFEDVKGDAKAMAWFFDEEMVRATADYHADLAKKDQFIRWRDRYWVDAGTRYYFKQVKWVDDGQSFVVHPAYRSEVPRPLKDGRGPRWLDAGLAAGQSKEAIQVKVVGGPLQHVGPHRFRIHYDELAPADARPRMTFMAYSEGDERYRYTEQVGMLPRGFSGFTEGRSQALRFKPLMDTNARGLPVKPVATSTAGRSVQFHVGYGPARIVDGEVQVTDLPRRVRYPIEVKVVAFEFGSGLDPKVKTAVPVAQTFKITGP